MQAELPAGGTHHARRSRMKIRAQLAERHAAAADFLSVDQNAVATFNHRGITYTNPPSDYSVRPSAVQDAIVGEDFRAIVVENAYIKATFVPGYGARMLSLIYKPTGHDLLDFHPASVPRGIWIIDLLLVLASPPRTAPPTTRAARRSTTTG